MPRALKVVEVPSIRQPITRSPGFAKKELSTWKLDVMALCGFGCRYCSSNEGNYLRINRAKFAALTEAQLGARALPAEDPDLAMVWPDVLDKMERQIRSARPGWGEGETIVVSMLTDAFSGPPLADGTTEKAVALLLERTRFRVRILTKNSAVGTRRWIRRFAPWGDRVVVGLSTGTLDAGWARRVEIGTPPPAARIAATRALQDAGIPTFGMLCPVFPDVLDADGLERLVNAIRPARCETVWAEPYNDRANWRAVRAGYDEGAPGWRWFTEVYGDGDRARWSRYATDLFLRLHDKATAEGWADRLRYLLYEEDVGEADAARFAGRMGSVLLQSKPGEDGRSRHPVFAGMFG